MPVTRETLYQEVWAEPMTTVAKRYDVSSSFLVRVCERLNVPRPPRGHWQRLAVGKAVERDALPDPQPGQELEWDPDRAELRRRGVSPRTPRSSASQGFIVAITATLVVRALGVVDVPALLLHLPVRHRPGQLRGPRESCSRGIARSFGPFRSGIVRHGPQAGTRAHA